MKGGVRKWDGNISVDFFFAFFTLLKTKFMKKFEFDEYLKIQNKNQQH